MWPSAQIPCPASCGDPASAPRCTSECPTQHADEARRYCGNPCLPPPRRAPAHSTEALPPSLREHPQWYPWLPTELYQDSPCPHDPPAAPSPQRQHLFPYPLHAPPCERGAYAR